MESSDESFAWIDASSASEDSDDESSENNMTEKHIESESEKSYKRKLHKKLFKDEADVKHEILNGDSVKHEPESDFAATPRKRKRKRERSTSAESTGHKYLETRVKDERHPDDKPKKHKKRHSENANEGQDVSQSSELGFSDYHVKQEDRSDEKPKKHKKRHSENANKSQNESQNSDLDSTDHDDRKKKYLETVVKQEHHFDEKPKKHKKRHSENANESQNISQSSEPDTTDYDIKKKQSLDAHVKEESNSDEKPRKHRKTQSQNGTESLDVENSELDSTDHHAKKKQYIDAQVKEEHSSDEKPKKHKKRHSENANESQDVSQSSELDTTDHKVKKKKSKRKKERADESNELINEDQFERPDESNELINEDQFERPDESNELINEDQFERPDETNEMIIEDKFEAEDTVVETRRRQSSINMDVDEDAGPRDEIVKKNKKKKKKRHVSEQEYHNSSAQENTSDARTSFTGNDANEDDAVESHNTDEELHNSSKSKAPEQRATKISERLQFEDEDDVISACNEATESFSNQSSKLKKFLRVNPHLHSIQSTSSGDSIISKDDDIWLFNCPHEVDVSSLKDRDISLDNKCKIKIDSHTFIGHVENEKDRAAILTFEHNRPVIKNVELQGVVNFRKRIPKPHFLEDNIIVNNQTNFIPLPDTKCRHPLFGPDYKKAMKIPSTIKSRLQNSDSEHTTTTKEEKKKKKRKYDETDMGVDVLDGLVSDEIAEKGTSHKHQLSDDTDQPVKKKKKIKHEKSGESWDSEKAIEENLFNF